MFLFVLQNFIKINEIYLYSFKFQNISHRNVLFQVIFIFFKLLNNIFKIFLNILILNYLKITIYFKICINLSLQIC